MLRFPDRIHKRPFIVGMLVLAFILVASGALSLVLRMFGTSNDFPIVTLSDTQSDILVRDVGINLDHLPASNLLGNPSFEATQHDAIFTIADSEDNSIFVSPDESTGTLLDNGFFAGGTIRVLSVDESGKLTTKLQTTISDYSMNQLGMWSELVKPADISEDIRILSCAASSVMTVGAGTQGTILSDMTSAEPRLIDTGIQEDYVAMFASSSRYCAVSRTGDFSYSSDGISWTTVSPQFSVYGSIHAGTSFGKTFIAAGDYGKIMICLDNEIRKVVSGTRESFRAATGDGSVILLAGDNGVIRTSANGLLFRELSASEFASASNSTNWTAADTLDGRFLLAGYDGAIAVGTYDNRLGTFSFVAYSAKDDTGRAIQSDKAVFLPSGEILLLDTEGELYCSDLTFSKWKKLNTEMTSMIDSVTVLPSGRILLTQAEIAKLTQLYTEISIESPQSEIDLRSGDTCLLSVEKPSVFQDEKDRTWQLGGDNSLMSVQEAAPVNGGRYSLRLAGDNSSSSVNAHFVSQKIAQTNELISNEGSIYEIKVWLKQEQIANSQVMAWVSGTAKPLGTTFSDVGIGWRQYTYSFVLPKNIRDASEIRLNIGFVGQGSLYIDKAYFGLAESSESFVNGDILTSICNAKPGMIRLANVSLGKMNVASEAWLQSAGNDIEVMSTKGSSWGVTSLDASLSLVRDANADPWIVIHSAADEQVIEQLMGYLCAGLTDPNGKIRADNGTPVPWSMQFDRFVFEISDTDQIFRSDTEKSSYVNYIISLISLSPYYLDIQDKVVFLDGMEYASKKMVSVADSHTCDISVTNYDQEQGMLLSFDAAVASAYSLYFDQMPRVPFSEQRVVVDAAEWARSAKLTMLFDSLAGENQPFLHQSITAANYTAVILSDLGKHTSSLMFDLSSEAPEVDSFSGSIVKSSELINGFSELNRNQQTLLNVIAFLGPASKGYQTDVFVSTPTMSESSVEGLLTYAFSEEETTFFIAANTSSQPLTFRLETPWPMEGDGYRKYGADGAQAVSSKLALRNNQVTLLPGEVFVAEISH